MKLKIFAGILPVLIAVASLCEAQKYDTTAISKYNYHEAFAPFFYTKNGNEFRAADGKPGPKYWQNRADYQLAATLNDVSNEITATEMLTYTNNSPQKLGFLW